MSKLRENIDRILGNSIRCLLPSYWWKRLFGMVVDEIEYVRKVASNKADKSYVDKTIDDALDNALDNVTIAVDTELSTTSKNPVQNKAVTTVLNNKQDKLVSSISIKTINWESLLGEGNINVNDNLLVLYFPDPSNLTLSLNDTEKASNEKVRMFFVSSTTSAPYSIAAYSVVEVNGVRKYYNAVVESIYHHTSDSHYICFRVRSEIDESTKTFKILTVRIRHDYAGYLAVYTNDIYDTKLSDTSANAVQNNVITTALNNKADTTYVDNAIANFQSDSEFSSISTRPVQNKVVKKALESKKNVIALDVDSDDLENLILEVLETEDSYLELEPERFEEIFGSFMRDNFNNQLVTTDVILWEDQYEPPYWYISDRYFFNSDFGIEFTKKEFDIRARNFVCTKMVLGIEEIYDDFYYYVDVKRWIEPEHGIEYATKDEMDTTKKEMESSNKVIAFALDEMDTKIKELTAEIEALKATSGESSNI